jgi:uncharacterized Zn-finger protein
MITQEEMFGQLFSSESDQILRDCLIISNIFPLIKDDSGTSVSSFGKKQSRKCTEEKKEFFQCTFPKCEKVFLRKANFDYHLNIHKGNKPYKCRVEGCVTSFSHAGNLKKHENTHKSEKPFSCNFEGCKKKFTASHTLKVSKSL